MRDRVKRLGTPYRNIINVFFFVRRMMRISTFNERRSVSDIIKRSSPTRATSTTTASDTAATTARALLLVAEARPRAWRVRTSCRAASTRFLITSVNSFFPFRSLCVFRRVVCFFLSSILSRRLLRARASRKTLSTQSRTSGTLMILPQVHLRKPCYDFYFL